MFEFLWFIVGVLVGAMVVAVIAWWDDLGG